MKEKLPIVGVFLLVSSAAQPQSLTKIYQLQDIKAVLEYNLSFFQFNFFQTFDTFRLLQLTIHIRYLGSLFFIVIHKKTFYTLITYFYFITIKFDKYPVQQRASKFVAL